MAVSRAEQILTSMINSTPYDQYPQSRLEDLLLQLKEVIEEGGGGGTPAAENVTYDNTESGATAENVQDALDEVFQSVSDGKEDIADAITDKGVPTSASDSFATMAENIAAIICGGDLDYSAASTNYNSSGNYVSSHSFTATYNGICVDRSVYPGTGQNHTTTITEDNVSITDKYHVNLDGAGNRTGLTVFSIKKGKTYVITYDRTYNSASVIIPFKSVGKVEIIENFKGQFTLPSAGNWHPNTMTKAGYITAMFMASYLGQTVTIRKGTTSIETMAFNDGVHQSHSANRVAVQPGDVIQIYKTSDGNSACEYLLIFEEE